MTERVTWWDDLAATCARGVRGAPWLCLLTGAALVLLLGRSGSPAAMTMQLAAAALLGASARVLCGRGVPTIVVLVLPCVVGYAYVAAALEFAWKGVYPFASSPGICLLALACASRVSLKRPGVRVMAYVLLLAGAVSVFGGRPSESFGAGVHDSLLHAIWPAAAACGALAVRRPVVALDARSPPRRPAMGAHRWLQWWLVPSIVLTLPFARFTGDSAVYVFASAIPASTVAIVYFAARVADHVDTDDARLERATTRLARAGDSNPGLLAAFAALVGSMLASLSTAAVQALVSAPLEEPRDWSARLDEFVDSATGPTLPVVGLLVLCTFSRRVSHSKRSAQAALLTASTLALYVTMSLPLLVNFWRSMGLDEATQVGKVALWTALLIAAGGLFAQLPRSRGLDLLLSLVVAAAVIVGAIWRPDTGDESTLSFFSAAPHWVRWLVVPSVSGAFVARLAVHPLKTVRAHLLVVALGVWTGVVLAGAEVYPPYGNPYEAIGAGSPWTVRLVLVVSCTLPWAGIAVMLLIARALVRAEAVDSGEEPLLHAEGAAA